MLLLVDNDAVWARNLSPRLTNLCILVNPVSPDLQNTMHFVLSNRARPLYGQHGISLSDVEGYTSHAECGIMDSLTQKSFWQLLKFLDHCLTMCRDGGTNLIGPDPTGLDSGALLINANLFFKGQDTAKPVVYNIFIVQRESCIGPYVSFVRLFTVGRTALADQLQATFGGMTRDLLSSTSIPNSIDFQRRNAVRFHGSDEVLQDERERQDVGNVRLTLLKGSQMETVSACV